ncbi:MAG: hypothetical protein KAV87_05065 [Desulfobacteraceae bacterium]|nr:hypothetical protein [Desulfobacteraceae bacterium]
MDENPTQKLNDITYLFSQILKHANALSGDAAGIIQEFFDSQFNISDISEIYELPKDKVKETISDFLVELLAEKHGLQRFLSISCVEGKDTVVDPREEANLLIETCKPRGSTAAKIREVIGTAIRINIPPAPDGLNAEIISKVRAICGSSVGKVVRFPIKLKEPDFFLGKQRIAAQTQVAPVAKTCSDGTVIVKRTAEKAEVGFCIELQKGTVEEYAINFHNLPDWAVPVSFSFIVPDEADGEKEYRLRSEFRDDRLYIRVEDRGQEMAFLDRKEAYIEFIISEPPEG